MMDTRVKPAYDESSQSEIFVMPGLVPGINVFTVDAS
jgi:hypothetical protein